jgi:hypothetical protein
VAAGQRFKAGDELFGADDRLHRTEADEGHLEEQFGEERAGDGLAAMHQLFEHPVEELGGATLNLSPRLGNLRVGE